MLYICLLFIPAVFSQRDNVRRQFAIMGMHPETYGSYGYGGIAQYDPQEFMHSHRTQRRKNLRRQFSPMGLAPDIRFAEQSEYYDLTNPNNGHPQDRPNLRRQFSPMGLAPDIRFAEQSEYYDLTNPYNGHPQDRPNLRRQFSPMGLAPDIRFAEQSEYYDLTNNDHPQDRPNLRRQFDSMGVQPDIRFADQSEYFDLANPYNEQPQDEVNLRRQIEMPAAEIRLGPHVEYGEHNDRYDLSALFKNHKHDAKRLGGGNFRRFFTSKRHQSDATRDQTDHEDDGFYHEQRKKDRKEEKRAEVRKNFRRRTDDGKQTAPHPGFRREEDMEDFMAATDQMEDIDLGYKPPDFRRNHRHHRHPYRGLKTEYKALSVVHNAPAQREINLKLGLPVKINVQDLPNGSFITGISIL